MLVYMHETRSHVGPESVLLCDGTINVIPHTHKPRLPVELLKPLSKVPKQEGRGSLRRKGQQWRLQSAVAEQLVSM